MNNIELLETFLKKHNAIDSYKRSIQGYKFKDIKELVSYLENESNVRYAIGGIMSFDNTKEGKDFWSRMDIEWKKICDGKKTIG